MNLCSDIASSGCSVNSRYLGLVSGDGGGRDYCSDISFRAAKYIHKSRVARIPRKRTGHETY
jgi:hypothetical protein